jgi:hypothetical protein
LVSELLGDIRVSAADFIFDGIESGRIPLVQRISARARVRLPGRVD